MIVLLYNQPEYIVDPGFGPAAGELVAVVHHENPVHWQALEHVLVAQPYHQQAQGGLGWTQRVHDDDVKQGETEGERNLVKQSLQFGLG